MKEGSEHIGTTQKCLTHRTRSQGLTRSYEYPSIFWQVCSDLLTAGALRNWWGDAIWCKHFSICKRLIWITLNRNDNIQIITLYYRIRVVENSINGFKPLQVMKLGAATVLSSIPTNTPWEQLKKGHGVNTCQHTFYVAAHNVVRAA